MASSLTLEKLFEFMQVGAIEGLLAIVTDEEPDLALMQKLRRSALTRYRAVSINKVGDGRLKNIPAESSELTLIYGMELCDPEGTEAHAIRSDVGFRKYRGLAAIICLSKDSLAKHFSDPKRPFYRFCGTVNQENIEDLIDRPLGR